MSQILLITILGLCPECSEKLNYKSKKREVKRLKKSEKKKKRKERNIEEEEKGDDECLPVGENQPEPGTSKETVDTGSDKDESLWKKGTIVIYNFIDPTL